MEANWEDGQWVCSFQGGPWRAVQPSYLLYLPRGYQSEAGRRWPLILCLHGAGERGDDIERVASQGLARRLAQGVSLPFVVASPQCPDGERWVSESLGAVLDELQRGLAVDQDQLFVTGMSMGGAATWNLAFTFPNRFAAIAPICGRGDPARACQIAHIPAWVFHGALDDVVPPQRSEEMVEALRACGAVPRFTLYADADHDSWTRTYEDPELYRWFLAHRRRQRAR